MCDFCPIGFCREDARRRARELAAAGKKASDVAKALAAERAPKRAPASGLVSSAHHDDETKARETVRVPCERGKA